MEELIGNGDSPKCCPDFRLLMPGEVAARGFVVYRRPNGDVMISEGAFIQLVEQDGELPDYRVQTDEGNVVRIVRFASDEDIHLGNQKGGEIVVEYHHTRAWTQGTDSSDLRFRKVGQPVTPNSVAPIVAPPVDLPGSEEVLEKGPVPQALVPDPWDIGGNEASAEAVPVESVVEHAASPKAEEPVTEVEANIEEEGAGEEAEQPSIIWIAPIGEESDHKCYRIERDKDSGNIVRVIEEVSGDIIPLTTKRVQNIISEAKETVWWTKFTNTSRLRFWRLQRLVPA